ncbi:MAG: hypothetical protein U0S12_12515 [Fimbriimonadales bacterium]
MSPFVLPGIAVFLAVLSLFVPFSKRDDAGSVRPSPGAFLMLAVIAAAGVLLGLRFGAAYPSLTGGSLGFGLGILLSAITGGLGFTVLRGKADSVPAALGLVAVSLTPWLGEGGPLGMVVGAGIGAWLAGMGAGEGESPSAARAAALAAVLVAANLLGANWPGEFGGSAGTVFGLVAVGGWVVPSLFLRGTARIVSALVLWIAGGYLVSTRVLNATDLWPLFGGGALAGLLVAWFLNDEPQASSFPSVLGAVLWLAAATTAFGMYKGLGMAVLGIAGVAATIVLDRKRALLALGPLVALVFYRVFREAVTDATRALDIGQHYAMIGLALGAMTPVLAYEWREGPGMRAAGRSLAGAAWGVLLMAIPLAGAVLLGPKGVIGVLVGFGFGSLIEALRGAKSGHCLTLGAALAAMTVLGYKWVEPYLDLARNEKLTALVWIGGAIAALALLIAFLSINPKAKSEAVKS